MTRGINVLRCGLYSQSVVINFTNAGFFVIVKVNTDYNVFGLFGAGGATISATSVLVVTERHERRTLFNIAQVALTNVRSEYIHTRYSTTQQSKALNSNKIYWTSIYRHIDMHDICCYRDKFNARSRVVISHLIDEYLLRLRERRWSKTQNFVHNHNRYWNEIYMQIMWLTTSMQRYIFTHVMLIRYLNISQYPWMIF